MVPFGSIMLLPDLGTGLIILVIGAHHHHLLWCKRSWILVTVLSLLLLLLLLWASMIPIPPAFLRVPDEASYRLLGSPSS